MVNEGPIEIIANDYQIGPGQGTIVHWQESKGHEAKPTLVLGCPDCGKVHWCTNHELLWDQESNTITLNPSLVCSSCKAHFLIQNNRFVPC